MHYCGMLAMHIEDGFIRWNGWLILASFVVAFLVCMIAVSFCALRWDRSSYCLLNRVNSTRPGNKNDASNAVRLFRGLWCCLGELISNTPNISFTPDHRQMHCRLVLAILKIILI